MDMSNMRSGNSSNNTYKESERNRAEYHMLTTDVTRNIIDAIRKENLEVAGLLMGMAYAQAYYNLEPYKKNRFKELSWNNVENVRTKEDAFNLFKRVCDIQSAAGLSPIQRKYNKSIFGRDLKKKMAEKTAQGD